MAKLKDIERIKIADLFGFILRFFFVIKIKLKIFLFLNRLDFFIIVTLRQLNECALKACHKLKKLI